MKHTFLFATIASILSINAYAVSTTVTSKDYVDTQDALKQNKIGVTINTFGNGSVVETTDEEGVVTQRGIFDISEDDDVDQSDRLITAGQVDTMFHSYADCVAFIDDTPSKGCLLWGINDGWDGDNASEGSFLPLK